MGAHAQSAEALRVVQLLVDVGEGDTVYRDLYLRRARALLAPVLSAGQYHGLEDASAPLINHQESMRDA